MPKLKKQRYKYSEKFQIHSNYIYLCDFLQSYEINCLLTFLNSENQKEFPNITKADLNTLSNILKTHIPFDFKSHNYILYNYFAIDKLIISENLIEYIKHLYILSENDCLYIHKQCIEIFQENPCYKYSRIIK